MSKARRYGTPREESRMGQPTVAVGCRPQELGSTLHSCGHIIPVVSGTPGGPQAIIRIRTPPVSHFGHSRRRSDTRFSGVSS